MITIQNVIDNILAAVPFELSQDTVDTVKYGDTSRLVTKVAVTFTATYDVIAQAKARGANFIITHEPTFYNHHDQTDWLTDKAVYKAKQHLLYENDVVIWRFHDAFHALSPDPTVLGIVNELKWEGYVDSKALNVCRIPPISLKELVDYTKSNLNIERVGIIGNIDQQCRHIGFLPGFPGKDVQINMINQPEIDVIICGEIHEWETGEYIRDALEVGHKKALILVGHQASEEPGIRWVTRWLQQRMPTVEFDYINAKALLRYL